MGAVVIYDELTNKILKVERSVNTPDYEGRTDVVLFDKNNRPTNLEPLLSIPVKYWKHDNGAIVEMTQPEKDAVDAEIQANSIQNKRQRLKNILNQDIVGQVIKAQALVMLGWVNEARVAGGLDTKTPKNLLDAVIAKIDNGDFD